MTIASLAVYGSNEYDSEKVSYNSEGNLSSSDIFLFDSRPAYVAMSLF